jgi:beta-mannosidase
MEINGRSIFCKGTNWVNPEIFPGVITRETYLPLLRYAQEANFNMLRSWGGGIINKDSFFELCDELGLMVWQEFPLACNNYDSTPQYLKILDQESKSIITRLRRHACLVLWCGGNELFNAWSGMTDQSLALRLLNRNCYDLDSRTPFLMTSPLMGMAHGNYLFRYQDGREVFQVMPQSSNTAYTEFGCPGPSPAQYIKSFIPNNELFPPLPGTTWETHHAFKAWAGDTWLQQEVINFYFGKANDLEQLVEWGQLLQSEGYKCIYEEARRQKPTCSMALNWCYNEPWPTAANNSLINWPAQPKPAYYAVKNSCRPVLASARIPKFTFEADELFSVELWILNDSPEIVSAGRVEALLLMDNETIKLLDWNYPDLEPRVNLPGPEIRFLLPVKECRQMILLLNTPDKPEMSSDYILLYNNNNK